MGVYNSDAIDRDVFYIRGRLTALFIFFHCQNRYTLLQ